MNSKYTAESRKGYWRRILRPLYWWVMLVLILYGIRLHQRTMEQTRIGFTVTLQWKNTGGEATPRLDGKPVVNREKISLGWHTFSITHPQAVTFSTNFFGWYGGRDFGQICLQRTMGTLKISATPPAQTVTITGPEFSTTLHAVTATNLIVPTDAYVVYAEYPHWSLSQTVSVSANQLATSEFAPRLGALHVESDPPGAEVRDGEGTSMGQTPLDVSDLKPQAMQLNLSLSGYQSVPLSLEITADQTNFCRTNLVSLRYLAAVRNARQFMEAGSYNLVVQAAKEALDAKPGDAEALALQTKAKSIIKAEQDRLERLKRLKEAFDALCKNSPDSRLFEEHELKTNKPAKEVANAILKSLQAEPSAFEITANDSAQPETYRTVAKQEFSFGTLGGSGRMAVIVVGQVKDDETQIWFRVLEYQIQHTTETNNLFNVNDNKQMIPLHSSRIEMNDVYQNRVQEGVRLVMGKIQQAIK